MVAKAVAVAIGKTSIHFELSISTPDVVQVVCDVPRNVLHGVQSAHFLGLVIGPLLSLPAFVKGS